MRKARDHIPPSPSSLLPFLPPENVWTVVLWLGSSFLIWQESDSSAGGRLWWVQCVNEMLLFGA